MNGIVTMRYVLIVLGVLLGIALVANGNVVVGGLVLVMSAIRLTMVIKLHGRRRGFEQRREEFRARRRERFSR